MVNSLAVNEPQPQSPLLDRGYDMRRHRTFKKFVLFRWTRRFNGSSPRFDCFRTVSKQIQSDRPSAGAAHCPNTTAKYCIFLLHEILFTVLAFLFFSATGGVRNTKLGHVFAEPLVWILGVDDVFD